MSLFAKSEISLTKYLRKAIIVIIISTIAGTISGLSVIHYLNYSFLSAAIIGLIVAIIPTILMTRIYNIDRHNMLTHFASIVLLTATMVYVPYFASHIYVTKIKNVHEVNINDKLRHYSIQNAELIFDKEQIGTKADIQEYTKTTSSRTRRRRGKTTSNITRFIGVTVVPFKSTDNDETQYWCAFLDYNETQKPENEMNKARIIADQQYERAMNINANNIDLQSFTKLSKGNVGYNTSMKTIENVNNESLKSDNIVILTPDEKNCNTSQFWTPFFLLALLIQIIGLTKMFSVMKKYHQVENREQTL